MAIARAVNGSSRDLPSGRLVGLWLAVMLLAGGLSPDVHAEPIGSVERARDTTLIQHATGRASRAERGTPLDAGDELSVGFRGYATVHVGGHVLRFLGGSRVRFLRLAGDDEVSIGVALLKGSYERLGTLPGGAKEVVLLDYTALASRGGLDSALDATASDATGGPAEYSVEQPQGQAERRRQEEGMVPDDASETGVDARQADAAESGRDAHALAEPSGRMEESESVTEETETGDGAGTGNQPRARQGAGQARGRGTASSTDVDEHVRPPPVVYAEALDPDTGPASKPPVQRHRRIQTGQTALMLPEGVDLPATNPVVTLLLGTGAPAGKWSRSPHTAAGPGRGVESAGPKVDPLQGRLFRGPEPSPGGIPHGGQAGAPAPKLPQLGDKVIAPRATVEPAEAAPSSGQRGMVLKQRPRLVAPDLGDKAMRGSTAVKKSPQLAQPKQPQADLAVDPGTFKAVPPIQQQPIQK